MLSWHWATRWATRARTSHSVQSVGRPQSSPPRVPSSAWVARPSAWATAWAWSGSVWGRRAAGVRESIIGLVLLGDAGCWGVVADEHVQDGGREPGEASRGGLVIGAWLRLSPRGRVARWRSTTTRRRCGGPR